MHTQLIYFVKFLFVRGAANLDHAFLYEPAQAHDFGTSASRSEEKSHHPVEGFRGTSDSERVG